MAKAKTKKRLERRDDVRDLYEKAGRHLGYALMDYDNAKLLKKAGLTEAAAACRDSGRRFTNQAKRFVRMAFASNV